MNTGTVQSQVRLQMLDLKWQKKKQDINHNNTENMTQDQIMLQSLEKQAEAERKRAATSEIYTKLKSGGTLTSDEIAYLKEHDPEALADYEKAQAEKKAYEQALKNCRTKEEVERLKLNRMGNFAAQAKSIANSPYIPKDKKLELMNKLNNEVCCIRDAHMEFVKSRAYEELPEEGEIAEERAKETVAETDEILAEQMETTEEIKADAVEAEKNDDSVLINTEENKDRFVKVENKLPNSRITELGETSLKSSEIQPEIGTHNDTAESKNMSFDRLIQDIERFLRKNDDRKSSFVANV